MSAAKKQGMVYVINDDESVRKALKRLFWSVDLDAETFSSVEEFLCNPRQEKSACVLIDIRMPGLTGFDLQQKLVADDIRIPIIVTSASDEEAVREEARKLGAVSFFRKPVDDQALVDAIWWGISESRRR